MWRTWGSCPWGHHCPGELPRGARVGYQQQGEMREKRNVAPGGRSTHTTATTRLEGNKDKRSDKTAQPQLQHKHQQRNSVGTSNRDTLWGRKPTTFTDLTLNSYSKGKKKKKGNNSVDTAWWAQCPIGARGGWEAKSKVRQTYKKWQVTGQFSSLTNNRQQIRPYTLTVWLKQRSSRCQKTPRASQVTCRVGTGGWRRRAQQANRKTKHDRKLKAGQVGAETMPWHSGTAKRAWSGMPWSRRNGSATERAELWALSACGALRPAGASARARAHGFGVGDRASARPTSSYCSWCTCWAGIRLPATVSGS